MTIQSVDSIEPLYVDTRGAAKLTGLSVFTFEQWRSRGTGGPPYCPVGDGKKKRILYKVAELVAWVERRHSVPAVTKLAADARSAGQRA